MTFFLLNFHIKVIFSFLPDAAASEIHVTLNLIKFVEYIETFSVPIFSNIERMLLSIKTEVSSKLILLSNSIL